MGRCSIQIVMGPAGSGKSTYCYAMQSHGATFSRKRNIHVANLDPAAEYFRYDVDFDIRDLISVTEVMEELQLGPNGALVYCMEYLMQNLEWLQEHLDSYDDDEYLILDCPGQLELYTHIPIMRRVVDQMRLWGFESSMVGVFCVDSTFLTDTSKFISGSLLALSAMIALELPHVNVLTKCDLMAEEDIERMLSIESASYMWDLEQHDKVDRTHKRYRLTEAISSLLDDYTMVSFLPLNINDEDSLNHVLATMDHTVQFGENQEVYTGDGLDNDIPDDED
jgi:GPN-loop GTPase